MSGIESLFNQIAAHKMPPVQSWNPPFCGDIDIRITVDGTWYYMGTPILRPAMVRLFSTVLRREQDGRYVLVTPVEKVGIVVEDAPFIAVAMETEGTGKSRKLIFRTNVEDIVLADAKNNISVIVDSETQSPRPYLHVRNNLHALIARSIFYELAEIAISEQHENSPLGVWSEGAFFAFGSLT
jgi:uncharacterized protein